MLTATLFPWDVATPTTRQAMVIRITVFVEEQHVPLSEEVDDLESTSTHVMVKTEDGQPVATARLYEHEPGIGRIGRMAVLKPWRGKGAGAKAMQALMDIARERRYHRLILDAQTHAIPFYEKFGFVVDGEEHLDCGIPHKMMAKELTGRSSSCP